VLIDRTLFIHAGYGPELAGVSITQLNQTVRQEIDTFDRTRSWMVDEGLALPWYSVHELIREAGREVQYVAEQKPSTVPAPRLERSAALQLEWNSWLLLLPEGPLWFRGAATWDESERTQEMAALLDSVGADRQVVGHTPQRTGRIQSRFGGRVFLIDTGMLEEVYKGRPSALEFHEGAISAIYPGERHILETSESSASNIRTETHDRAAAGGF
jgi:hypothetical protein